MVVFTELVCKIQPHNQELEDALGMHRWAVSGLTATGLILGLYGCQSEPKLNAHIEWQGYRGLRRLNHALLPVFDAERAPRLRWPTPGPVSIQWISGDVQRPIPNTTDAHGLTLDLSNIPFAVGQLNLTSKTHQLRTTIEWAQAPNARPALVHLMAKLTLKAPEQRPAMIDAALLSMTEADQLWGLVELARAYARIEQIDASAQAWLRGAELAKRLEWPSEQARRLRAAAFNLLHLQQFAQAEAALVEAVELSDEIGDTAGRARADYYRGAIAQRTGMLREARHLFERVRASQADNTLMTSQALSLLLSEIGHHKEALALLEQLPQSPKQAIITHNNRAWIRLRQSLSTGQKPDLDKIRTSYEAALALIDHMANGRRDLLANLAEVDMISGDLVQARSRLNQIERDPPGEVVTFVELLDAEILLREQKTPKARDAFQTLINRYDHTIGNADVRWQSWYGLGRAERQLGHMPEAQIALETAISVMQAAGRRTSFNDARATFLADRRGPVDVLAQLHLAAKRPRQALTVLDAARSYVIRQAAAQQRLNTLPPAERTAWLTRQGAYARARTAAIDAGRVCNTLPSDERQICLRDQAAQVRQVESAFNDLFEQTIDQDEQLPTLSPEEALLAYARIGSQLHGFWLHGEEAIHALIDDTDPLTPFASQLTDVKHLYVVRGPVPFSKMQQYLSHGQPLAQQIGLSEIPFAAWLSSPHPAPTGGALVIADPTADLAGARIEGQQVATWLNARTLIGSMATREAMMAQLENTHTLHYAGHGDLAGPDPWSAHLRLAQDTRLSLADLLATRPALRLVVLSGCDTGTLQPLSRDEALGLADGFLLSGTQTVLSTTRKVDDAGAQRFMTYFYKQFHGAQHPGSAFRQTVAALHTQGDPIWTAFKLMGRP